MHTRMKHGITHSIRLALCALFLWLAPLRWTEWSTVETWTRTPFVDSSGMEWIGSTRWRDGAIVVESDVTFRSERMALAPGQSGRLVVERISGRTLFELEFARAGGIRYRLVHGDDERGVVALAGDGSRAMLLPAFPLERLERIRSLALRIEDRSLSVQIDRDRREVLLPIRPDSLFFDLDCRAGRGQGEMLIGSIELQRDGDQRPSAYADFQYMPVAFDLTFTPFGAWSRSTRWALTLLLCTLLGWSLEASVARFSDRRDMDEASALLFATPFFIAAPLILGMALSLPLSVVAVYALLTATHRGIAGTFALRAPSYIALSTALFLVSLALLFSVKLFHPGENERLLTFLFLLPWTLHTIGVAAKAQGMRRAAIAIPIVAQLSSLEYALRARSSVLHRLRLDFDAQVDAEFWDISRHTDLFGNHRGSDVLEFKGREFFKERPTGKFRVTCLGSSSTWGSNLPITPEHGYPAELERLLRECDGIPVEVINAGVPGAGATMLRIYLEDVVLATEPDLVIFYFGHNRERLENKLLYPKMRTLLTTHPWIGDERELAAALELRWRHPWLVHGYQYLLRLRTFGLIRATATDSRIVMKREDDPEILRARLGSKRMRESHTYERITLAALDAGAKVLLIPEVGNTAVWAAKSPCERIFVELASGDDVQILRVENELRVPPHEAVFIDNVHLTDRGCRVLAEAIAPRARSMLIDREP